MGGEGRKQFSVLSLVCLGSIMRIELSVGVNVSGKVYESSLESVPCSGIL